MSKPRSGGLAGSDTSSERGWRLTAAAEADIATILRESGTLFGPAQRHRYAEMITAAIALLAEKPMRLGSRARPELGSGVRAFHVERAVKRRGAASHQIFYLPVEAMAGVTVLILRVLHERMDPFLHVRLYQD